MKNFNTTEDVKGKRRELIEHYGFEVTEEEKAKRLELIEVYNGAIKAQVYLPTHGLNVRFCPQCGFRHVYPTKTARLVLPSGPLVVLGFKCSVCDSAIAEYHFINGNWVIHWGYSHGWTMSSFGKISEQNAVFLKMIEETGGMIGYLINDLLPE